MNNENKGTLTMTRYIKGKQQKEKNEAKLKKGKQNTSKETKSEACKLFLHDELDARKIKKIIYC